MKEKDRDICRPELTYMKVENKNDSYYQFEWTDFGADKDALYTFVCIENVGNILYPIKTVRAGEPREAKIGRVSLETLYSIWSLEDGIAEGNKYFRLYVIYDDGHMVSSDPIYIEFD